MQTLELKIPGITDKGVLACLSRARRYQQYLNAVADALAGRCAFCDVDRARNNVIFENNMCLVWPCNPPEANTAFHFLLVPKRHVTDSTELTDLEILCVMREIPEFLKQKFGIKSRGMLVRDGDATLMAGTISHLHFHIMVPNGTGRVESPFFKGAEAELQSLKRAIVFEKMRTGTQFSWLSPEEQDLVKDRL